jgi:transposase-like protein
MVIRDACPACGSKRYKKNGHTRHGKQHHQCKACERQFGATAEDHLISEAQRTMIEHLLRERTSLRGICRAVGVSLTWLLRFMVKCFAACPDDLQQLPLSSRRNELPVKLIDGSLVMCHEHSTCALVELMQIGKAPSGAKPVLHHPPEPFNGMQMMTTVGR